MERRKSNRKTCFFAEVDYSAKNEVFTDSIRNISKEGVFIETRESLSIGDDVTMLFSDLAQIDLIRVTGDVVRSMPSGVAVKFEINEKLKKETIEQFVEKI
jgi:Tfp pilus assembly protein PilZ